MHSNVDKYKLTEIGKDAWEKERKNGKRMKRFFFVKVEEKGEILKNGRREVNIPKNKKKGMKKREIYCKMLSAKRTWSYLIVPSSIDPMISCQPYYVNISP